MDALEESEARYRTLFDQSPIGVVAFDRSYHVTDCNAALVRLFRSSYDKLIGFDLRTLRDPVFLPLFRRVIEDGEPMQYEGPYDATTSDVRVIIAARMTPLRGSSGEVVAGLALIEDVTERRNAEAALQRSEARFRTLIEHAPDAIGVFRGESHVYVNPALAAYMGYPSPDAMMHVRVVDFIHPDDRATFHERNRRRAKGEKLGAHDYRLVRKDGRIVNAEITSMPIELDGEPAVLVIMRDVTERKQLQVQLLQADRMASVGMLAAGIAHEINNPLSYVMANLEVIARTALPELARTATPEQAAIVARLEAMIASASDGAERVRRIVRDVKTFSRERDDVHVPLDVAAVLEATLHLVENELRHRARLERDYRDVPRVSGNESRLGQVFLNLLVNAVHSLVPRETGENVIRVRVHAPDAQRVVVEVSDTGVGIAPEVLPRIFDPFFTTKAIGVGTGLGLFVCQGIVTSLGGTLDVESRKGEGTTFRVTLPPQRGRAPETTTKRAPAPLSTSRARGRLLVVDDEPAMGRALLAAFADELDVTLARSGNEALAAIEAGPPFDAVVCDLMMPGMTGMDTWQTVRRRDAALADRFVFVTGGAFTKEAHAFLEAPDCPEAVEKPFALATLREAVERAMARRK